ncbi:amidophosphoribosyltransferase [Patella vulgata]|uniref:amidophosphoribosyltransferase n=1 Tax=Patella vulgata TaxID=6465 RepID=UPI0021801350|nr:amidophosphoribosyltransferase [Patella vulgata]XP_050416471.1 amidophosphoribosyltransferase [Patella vulgata]XP_050416472.1 amidophosphoribosyltransferase [Patella vulgata]XP_050416473.1 amidophosphoribosyltransferase [Patella vulgata]XP_050416474.1 amidophosphoribosyltransferase [Patella vulgata]
MCEPMLHGENEESGLRHYCGVFGAVAIEPWPTELDIPHIITLGLVGLQHRGQESAGIVTTTGEEGRFITKKGMGLVEQIFKNEDMIRLKGNMGIGHTRYSTMGGSELINIQPFVVNTAHGKIAVAHNGEIVNAPELRHKLLKSGVGLSTDSDSELITQFLTHPPSCGEPNGANWVNRIKSMMKVATLSYALLIMYKDVIYAVRDPFGNRPLSIGKILPPSFKSMDLVPDENVEGFVVGSETCSFHTIGAKFYRDVLPGEIVEISKSGIKSCGIVPRPNEQLPAFCIFEYVYFARADSIFESQMVYTARQRCGRQLALEAPADADIVSTVPESATPSAVEYAKTVGLPYTEIFSKNRYIGRTFIQPTTRLRQLGVAKKFGPLTDNFDGKRIVLIDDSIVRGNTMQALVKLLKKYGAKEVHVRVASPPIKYPCYMGINIPTKQELIANRIPLEDLPQHLCADSVKYLSIEGLVKAVQEGIQDNGQAVGHCTACLSGDYPVKLDW